MSKIQLNMDARPGTAALLQHCGSIVRTGLFEASAAGWCVGAPLGTMAHFLALCVSFLYVRIRGCDVARRVGVARNAWLRSALASSVDAFDGRGASNAVAAALPANGICV